jgi:hypothetical protein
MYLSINLMNFQIIKIQELFESLNSFKFFNSCISFYAFETDFTISEHFFSHLT